MCISFKEVLSGIVAIAGWSILAYIYFYGRRFLYWSKIPGSYQVHRKYRVVNDDKGEYEIKITRKGNKLNVNSVNLSEGNFTGEIIMDEIFKRAGKGYYMQDKLVNNVTLPLWGYFEIALKRNGEIFVHKYYVNDKNIMIFEGFVWKKEKITKKENQ
jgi:hypothetical protein